MHRSFFLLLTLVSSTLSAADPFVPAISDPRVGDWQATGATDAPAALVHRTATGGYQVNLLRAFDGDAEMLVGLLTSGDSAAGAVTLRGDLGTATLTDDRLVVSRGDETATYERVLRPSPTLGAEPPAGAVVLFDGQGWTGWTRKKGRDWLVPDGPPEWLLRPEGAMEVIPGTDSLISEAQFGDGRLHAEFRTLGVPTNSGIYLQARYEVDLNETYGRTEGTPCGSLGNCSPVKPTLRASRAPGEWQTLEVAFRAPRFDADGRKVEAARATVVLNGVTLYADQELDAPKGAAGRLGEAPIGPILLQEHGAPLQFRNLWFVPSTH